MLLELHITNFAIIEDISLNFKKGMTVLTGETGAGKSIIIDALGLLSGGRGSSDFVRYGTKKCTLEGHFEMPENKKLEEVFIEHSIENEEILIIQREIYQTGRNVCRVNGSIVNISLLKKIGSYLIDIHGQNEHQELMQSENHLYLLDYFDNENLKNQKLDYEQAYKQYRKVYKKYNKWQNKEQENAQKIDILTFQIEEIQEANLTIGEEEELIEEEMRLANFQSIMEALSVSYQVLQETEVNALSLVGQSMDALKNVENVDSELKNISDQVTDAFYQLQEVASDIYSALDTQEFDENRLNEIAERLNLIQQLKRKYGSSINEILDFYEEAQEELSQIEGGSQSKAELAQELDHLKEEVLIKGKKLSESRRKIASELESSIHKQLAALYMDKVIFSVHFDKNSTSKYSIEDATKDGLDKIEFYISTNPGEPVKPLTRIASGGELSRIMLAMKTIFTKSQGITSIIFDEIDTGVSGRVAQAIAEKIYSVSVHSQVLCITHLPQVAAIADNHLYVKKAVEDERTSTQATILSENRRVEEVARMLSGSELTTGALHAAEELRLISEKNKKDMYK